MTWTYVVDTSALIDMHELYPKSSFPGVWKKLTALVNSQRAIAPKQVRDEIVKSEFLKEWCKANSKMFLPPTSDDWDKALMIVRKFPKLAKQDKFGQQADPFIIARAILLKSVVDENKPMIITQEDPVARNKIPHVAKSFNIKSDGLVGLFNIEGWKFGST